MTTWADIQRGIFAGESGGDYGALYGYANRPNNLFSDVNLTGMTLNQVIDFTNPRGPYAQYVSALNDGTVATPVGAYQVVGSTLRDAVQGLGLSGDTLFDEATQDRIGKWIYDTQGTGAWEGYRGPQPTQSTRGPVTMPTMPQQQRPQGLLEYLGVQKRGTGGPQGDVPFYQRDRFKDVMGNLAMAFNQAEVRPDQTLAERMGQAKARREGNRTIEWLSTQPNGEAYARMIESGAPASAVLAQYQKDMAGSQVKGIAVEGRIVNPVTGEVIYEPSGMSGTLSKEQIGAANTLRDDLRTDLSNYETVRDGYESIMTFYNNPGGVSDYALAVGFAKILDPGSVVREGEVAAVARSGALSSALKEQIINALSGKGALPPDVRQEIAELSTKRYASHAESAEGVLGRYEDMATRSGITMADIYAGSGVLSPQPIVPSVAPTVLPDMGISQEEWQRVWDKMPEQDKMQFLNGGF